MEVSAKLRYVHLSARKAKLVLDVVRGRLLADALVQLSMMPQGAARPVAKLLASAAANATNNNKLEAAKLWVKRIEVGQGPRLKRWLPRAMGRATPIQKPTSHVTVVLSDEAPRRPQRS